jgi:hypothetical protein
MFLTSSLIGLAAPLTCFLLHILAYRVWPAALKMQRQKLTVVVVLFAILFAAVLAGSLTMDLAEALNAGLVSSLFGLTYFHWFNMSETARRIRMLVRYVALGATETQEPYNAEMILNNRLQRLSDTSTIVLVNGKFVLQRGPLLWATRVILFWRSLFYVS